MLPNHSVTQTVFGKEGPPRQIYHPNDYGAKALRELQTIVAENWVMTHPFVACIDTPEFVRWYLTMSRSHGDRKDGEVLEALAEAERPVYNPRDHAKELTDIEVFVLVLASTYIRQIGELDYEAINTRSRTFQAQSSAYDQLLVAAGDIGRRWSQLRPTLQQIMVIIATLRRHNPLVASPIISMRRTIRINGRNYPNTKAIPIFSGVHPETHEPLNPDDKLRQYHHAVKALHILREASGNGKHGLPPQVILPFLPQLLDFEDSKASLATMEEQAPLKLKGIA